MVSAEGWNTSSEHARYWKSTGDAWLERRFSEWVPLQLDLPVMHVDWHERTPTCRYAGRRLPTEPSGDRRFARWDGGRRRYPWGNAIDAGRANLNGAGRARGAVRLGRQPRGCRQMIATSGNGPSSAFAPYPGFVADPYEEYSEPWFGTHKFCAAAASRRRRADREQLAQFLSAEPRRYLCGVPHPARFE